MWLRLQGLGTCLARMELYRFGADIPTEWEGQHGRLKAIITGVPNQELQVWYTVRASHEREDAEWWRQHVCSGLAGRVKCNVAE